MKMYSHTCMGGMGNAYFKVLESLIGNVVDQNGDVDIKNTVIKE